jgi:hypothetical protein
MPRETRRGTFHRAACSRATKDTWASITRWGFGVPALAIFVLGSTIHYYRFGSEAVMDEWQIWLSYTLATIGALALALFSLNLVCAPFRLERERADAAEIRVQDLETQVGPGISCEAVGSILLADARSSMRRVPDPD